MNRMEEMQKKPVSAFPCSLCGDDDCRALQRKLYSDLSCVSCDQARPVAPAKFNAKRESQK